MSKITELLDGLEDIDQKCEELASLAFVTWNSFSNGRFSIEREDYEPVLRVLMDHAVQLEKELKDIISRMYDKKKGGADA